MTGVLIVAHGSRAKETELTIVSVLDMVKEKMGDIYIELAFMEFSEKTIEAGMKALINKGARKIKIVPYFLFTGVHLKEDIPNMVNDFMKDYPEIQVTMGEALGTDERLAEILVDRIKD